MKELLIKIKALFDGKGTKQAADDVAKVGQAADQAKTKTGGLAGAMSDGSAKAGIFAGATAALGTALLGIAQQAITACIGAIKNLVQGFADGVMKAADFAGAMTDLSARTGQPIEQLVVLQRAFENAGMSGEAVGPMLNRLQKALSGVNEEGQPTSAALDKLGLKVSELNRMSSLQQLDALAGAIAKLPTPAAQAAASMEIFGRSGGQILAVLKDGAAFKTAAEQVGSLGANLAKVAPQLDAFSDAVSGKNLDAKKMQFFAAASAQFAGDLERAGVALNKLDIGPLGEQVGYVVRGLVEVNKALVQMAGGVEAVKAGFNNLYAAIQNVSMTFGLLTDGVAWLRNLGREAALTEQNQNAVAEANRRIATSAQDAADFIARARAESQGVGQGVAQAATATVGQAVAQGSGQIAASGDAAQQGIGTAGADAVSKIKLSSYELQVASAAIVQAMSDGNTQGVRPAIEALVMSVRESFGNIMGEFRAATAALQAEQAAQAQQTAAALAAQTAAIEATRAAAQASMDANAQSLAAVGEQIQAAAQAAAAAAQESAGQIGAAVGEVGGAIARNNAAVAGGFAALSNRISVLAASLQSQINALAARR